MNRSLRLAGITAGLVLVAFGVGAVLVGLAGRSEVGDTIKREQIVGTPDMTPSLIAASVKAAGLMVEIPTCSVAGKAIASGDDAKCFAAYMRIHALEATGGKTYAQMRSTRPLTARARATRPRRSSTRRPAARRATRRVRSGSARPPWAPR